MQISEVEMFCVRMKEKIKIISDGERAEVYIDGKEVPCVDIELHFSGHVGREPMITFDATWIKTNRKSDWTIQNLEKLFNGH